MLKKTLLKALCFGPIRAAVFIICVISLLAVFVSCNNNMDEKETETSSYADAAVSTLEETKPIEQTGLEATTNPLYSIETTTNPLTSIETSNEETTTKETTITEYYESLNNTKTKMEIFEEYKNAVNKLALNGTFGFTKSEWGNLNSVSSGDERADEVFWFFAKKFIPTKENSIKEIYAKATSQARQNFPACSLADESLIKEAIYYTHQNYNDIYGIKIVVESEKNPNKETSHLSQISNTVIFWDDIKEILDGIWVVKSINQEKSYFNYDDYVIFCEFNKDGDIVFMSFIAEIDARIDAEISLIKTYDIAFKSKIIHHVEFFDFQY